ncbi:MAG: hypothetical protein PVG43_08635, partial [Nitrosopumilaceae archaeon]
MTSIMLATAIAIINSPLAFADLQPADCTTSSQSLSLTWYRADKATTVAGSNSPVTNQPNKVDIGEELYLQASLTQPLSNGCDYLNGTLFVTTPDLVDYKLSMNVPTISFNASSFSNFTGAYFASPADDADSCNGSVDGLIDGKLTACAFYGIVLGSPGGAVDGVSHSSDSGEDTANASNNVGVNFVVPPGWNATTLANVTGTQSDPVVDPLDVVSIVADTGFNGTFTGNFTLGNSTDVFDTGACTGGVVNATTGEATLNCQAIGTFANTIGENCFDVTINAPSPFTPSNSTLLGSDDSENECFSITPPSWNATTLANVTGTQSEPVVDPLDVVTIVADEDFLGTFTGNFTLGNSTDVFDTGACTGGAVNATTGEATLNCQAIGIFDIPVGDTCFDVTINAPSPYTPITD